MAFQVSPGINVSEIDLTTVVPNVATSIGATAGTFQWGPVMERTSITNENDLVRVFGEPNDDTFGSFLSAANYLSYSNNLLVVRVVAESAKNSQTLNDSTLGTVLADHIDNATDYDATITSFSAAATDPVFIGKYPGALGNSLKVHAIDSHGWAATLTGAALATQTKFKSNFNGTPGTSTSMARANGDDGSGSATYNGYDEMHVMVVDEDGLWTGVPGQVLEKFDYVSKASDAKRIDGSSNYVRNVLRNESKYVWLGNVQSLTATSTDEETDAGAGMAGTVFNQFNSATDIETMPGGSLGLGVDGNVLADGIHQAGLGLYTNPEAVDVTLVMQGGGSVLTEQWIKNNIADSRKDCVALVSGEYGSSNVTDLKDDGTALGSSSYAIMDGAWKYQYDRYNDVFRWVTMNADIAGLCARTDFTNDAWWSPAGLNRGQIKNAIKLSWEPSKADRDSMYQAGINPIITMPGAGVVLWGDKTMQNIPSAFDRINVRRLFIVLEKAISTAAKAMLFEFNDEFTRSQFVNMVEPFLREIQGRHGITDFKVVCDNSNNSGQIIDTNQFVGDIYVKPARSINFIQLNFIAARSDVSFSEIGG